MGNLRFKTKNQEPRLAQESLGNLGSWFLVLGNLRFNNQEPRFAQESLGNLGSWFLVLGNLRFKNQEPRFAQESLGNLGSWFLVLGFGSEIPRFVQESLGDLGSWFLVLVRKFKDLFRSPGRILVLGFSRECILNAFFPECYHCS